MNQKSSFTKLIQLWGIVFLLGIGLSIVAIDILISYHDFNSRAVKMRMDYIARQKQIVKQEVERVVDKILYEKRQSEMLARQRIKSRVYEAYSIAQNIYQNKKTDKNKSDVQQRILDALRYIRFEYESGYYFATRLDGIIMLFSDKPEKEGFSLLEAQDTHGQHVIKDMIEIAEQSGEGFYEYRWTKPDEEGDDFRKISFIKLFEPYNWYIGTGLYVDDVETQIKNELLNDIALIRFGPKKDGYIFVVTYDGTTLMNDTQRHLIGKNIWELTDPNGVKVIQEERRAVENPEGGFIYYSWNKPFKEQLSPKTSFMKGIKSWEWMIGAGVYLDDVEKDIVLMQTELNDQIKMKMFFSTLISIGIIVFFLFLFGRLNRRLINNFDLLTSFFSRVTASDEPINRSRIQFFEFDRMAESANKMQQDKIHAQQDLLNEREALLQSESKFRGLIESTSDWIWEINAEMICTYASPQVKTILGYRSEALFGKIPFLLMPTEEAGRIERLFKDAFEKGEPVVALENVNLHKDGRRVVVETSGVPFFNSKGELVGYRGVNRDITERKKTEKEKTKLQAQLNRAEKMETIGTLAGGVAHDLNNILGAIVGYPDLMLDDLEEDSPFRSSVVAIKESGERAASIVQDLLTLARRGVPVREVISLNSVISKYLSSREFYKLKEFYPKVRVETKLASDLLNLEGSPVHLAKIVMNLISNASESIPRDGKVTISTENIYLDKPVRGYDRIEEGDYVVLTAADEGIGISGKDLKRIFEPFYTKKVMGRSGTGLGMAVVWGTLKDHKGYIDVESEEGVGTVFKLYFPVSRKGIEDNKKSVLIDEYLGSGEKILVVDDIIAQREIASNMLTRLNYRVTAVESGEKAVAYLENNSADILILDMIMDPGMDGCETYEKILENHPGQKAIIASGFSETDRVKEAQKAGAGEYIRKPYTLEKIGLAVKSALSD